MQTTTPARELYDQNAQALYYPDWGNPGALWTSVARHQNRDFDQSYYPHIRW